MNLTPYEIALISGGFAIVGGLAGAWAGAAISRKSAFDILQRQIFNQAAATFRCAFTRELRLLEESTIDTDFINLFSSAYVRHCNAVIRFKSHLSKTQRIEIEKAWQDHCYPQGLDEYERTFDSAKFIHYDHSQKIKFNNGKPLITEEHEASFKKAKNLATNNIGVLLSFAEIK